MPETIKESRAYSLEEYVELTKNSEEKIEYFNGEIWQSESPSRARQLIAGNTFNAIKNALQWHTTHLFDSNTRIKVPALPPFRYPVLTGLYGEPIFEDFYNLKVLVNPALIVEILTPSTELFIRVDKFFYYKSILNFTDYLLIAEDRIHVTLLTREDEETWLHREYNSLDKHLYLFSMDCEIQMAEIYRDIEIKAGNRPVFKG